MQLVARQGGQFQVWQASAGIIGHDQASWQRAASIVIAFVWPCCSAAIIEFVRPSPWLEHGSCKIKAESGNDGTTRRAHRWDGGPARRQYRQTLANVCKWPQHNNRTPHEPRAARSLIELAPADWPEMASRAGKAAVRLQAAGPGRGTPRKQNICAPSCACCCCCCGSCYHRRLFFAGHLLEPRTRSFRAGPGLSVRLQHCCGPPQTWLATNSRPHCGETIYNLTATGADRSGPPGTGRPTKLMHMKQEQKQTNETLSSL